MPADLRRRPRRALASRRARAGATRRHRMLLPGGSLDPRAAPARRAEDPVPAGRVRDHSALAERVLERVAAARADFDIAPDEELRALNTPPHAYDPPDAVLVKRLLQDGLPDPPRGRSSTSCSPSWWTRTSARSRTSVYLTLEDLRELARRGMDDRGTRLGASAPRPARRGDAAQRDRAVEGTARRDPSARGLGVQLPVRQPQSDDAAAARRGRLRARLHDRPAAGTGGRRPARATAHGHERPPGRGSPAPGCRRPSRRAAADPAPATTPARAHAQLEVVVERMPEAPPGGARCAEAREASGRSRSSAYACRRARSTWCAPSGGTSSIRASRPRYSSRSRGVDGEAAPRVEARPRGQRRHAEARKLQADRAADRDAEVGDVEQRPRRRSSAVGTQHVHVRGQLADVLSDRATGSPSSPSTPSRLRFQTFAGWSLTIQFTRSFAQAARTVSTNHCSWSSKRSSPKNMFASQRTCEKTTAVRFAGSRPSSARISSARALARPLLVPPASASAAVVSHEQAPPRARDPRRASTASP